MTPISDLAEILNVAFVESSEKARENIAVKALIQQGVFIGTRLENVAKDLDLNSPELASIFRSKATKVRILETSKSIWRLAAETWRNDK